MKRTWIHTLLLCAVVLLITSFLTGFWTERPENSILKVGFVYAEDESTPFTANFIQAQRALSETYEGRIEIFTRSNVPVRNAEQPIRELIQDGCTLLFINLGTDIPATMAWEYPEVTFCQISLPDTSIEGTPDNYHTFNGEIYQARYASGVAAGMKLHQLIDSGKLLPKDALVGYVGANATTEVISGYTAFLLGVRSVAPEAVMHVRYTGSWSNFNAEKKQTQLLIDEGCVIIAEHVNTSASAIACEEASAAGKTVYHIGYHQSMADVAPSCALLSVRINWSPYITGAVGALLSGQSIESAVSGHTHGRDISAGFENGWVELLDLNRILAAEGTEDALNRIVDDLKRGRIQVFSGDYIGVSPRNSAITIDLNNGYTENQNSSYPSFNYILKDCIVVENTSVGD